MHSVHCSHLSASSGFVVPLKSSIPIFRNLSYRLSLGTTTMGTSLTGADPRTDYYRLWDPPIDSCIAYSGSGWFPSEAISVIEQIISSAL